VSALGATPEALPIDLVTCERRVEAISLATQLIPTHTAIRDPAISVAHDVRESLLVPTAADGQAATVLRTSAIFCEPQMVQVHAPAIAA
jgi:hypothetical protein